jgi:uncharacterized membrane protein YczE
MDITMLVGIGTVVMAFFAGLLLIRENKRHLRAARIPVREERTIPQRRNK